MRWPCLTVTTWNAHTGPGIRCPLMNRSWLLTVGRCGGYVSPRDTTANGWCAVEVQTWWQPAETWLNLCAEISMGPNWSLWDGNLVRQFWPQGCNFHALVTMPCMPGSILVTICMKTRFAPCIFSPMIHRYSVVCEPWSISSWSHVSLLPCVHSRKPVGVQHLLFPSCIPPSLGIFNVDLCLLSVMLTSPFVLQIMWSIKNARSSDRRRAALSCSVAWNSLSRFGT